MKVLKFGGTSVGSVESIKTVVSVLQSNRKKKKEIAVVFSAMSGVTNQLIEAGRKAAEGEDAYKNIVQTIENKHIHAVKALIDVKFQSKVVANIKMLINELDDLLNGVYLLGELSPRTLDTVQSFGERLSC